MEENQLGISASSGLAVKQAPSAKEQYWLPILKEFKRSQLSQKKFCELKGLKPKTLSRWKRHFKQQQRKGLKPNLKIKSEEPLKQGDGVNFLSLELIEPYRMETAKIEGDKVMFHHRSGFSVALTESSNRALFKLGLSLLMELSAC